MKPMFIRRILGARRVGDASPRRVVLSVALVACLSAVSWYFIGRDRALLDSDRAIPAPKMMSSVPMQPERSASSGQQTPSIARIDIQQESQSGVREAEPASTNSEAPETIVIRESSTKEASADRISSAAEHDRGSADGASATRSRSIDVHSDSRNCKSCRNSSIRNLTIGNGCEYELHKITQLDRQPFISIRTRASQLTSYRDIVHRDAAGNIHAVELSVESVKLPDSREGSSITMRLTIVETCLPTF